MTVQAGKQVCKSPKTRSSIRTVSSPAFLTERIKRLQESRIQDKAHFGVEWEGDDWLFITHDGSMMNYSTPYQALKDAISRYNDGQDITDQLPDIPFHGLRHTSATLLISTKPDVATVSKRLGHAHTSVTLDIYTHALEENERSASDALEALLGK